MSTVDDARREAGARHTLSNGEPKLINPPRAVVLPHGRQEHESVPPELLPAYGLGNHGRPA